MTQHTDIFRRLGLAWLLLLIIPGLLLLTRYQLFPLIDLQSNLATILYWITSTGTAPYGVATVVFVLVIAHRMMPKTLFISLFLAISLSQLSSLALSHTLKPYFKEPRPNLVFLTQQDLPTDAQLSLDTFYQLDKQTRSKAIASALEGLKVVKPEMKFTPRIHQHWQDEVSYSFPSGHTIFAVTLVLTAGYYLLLAGLPSFILALVAWALLMGLSRMLLGMHWPQDVLFSTVLAVFTSGFGIFIVNKLRPLKCYLPEKSID